MDPFVLCYWARVSPVPVGPDHGLISGPAHWIAFSDATGSARAATLHNANDKAMFEIFRHSRRCAGASQRGTSKPVPDLQFLKMDSENILSQVQYLTRPRTTSSPTYEKTHTFQLHRNCHNVSHSKPCFHQCNRQANASACLGSRMAP